MLNNVKVFVLMAGLTALLMMIGGSFFGAGGAGVFLLISAGMNVFMYYNSSKMVLKSYGAKVVGPSDAPKLYEAVDRLRQRAGLPMPVVAIAPHPQPNAFATGRNPEHAVVCVTQGIMNLVSQEELEGVLAHELAHIKNRDMLLQTITATMAGAISNLAYFGGMFSSSDEDGHPALGLVSMIVAPIAAMLVQFAISRQREFKADAVGAEICGHPISLANALRKLERGATAMPMQVSPSVAPLAQVNPFGGARLRGLAKLFSTHPATEERVARLEAIARNGVQSTRYPIPA